jgi:hypothetical protein
MHEGSVFMHPRRIRVTTIARCAVSGFAIATLLLAIGSTTAMAAILPIGVEQDSWSDMAYASGVTGSFNSGTKILTLNGFPSNDLEIGEEFGPSNAGRHYGTGGTLGGPFSANLSLTGVVVEADGSVSAGGTVQVTHEGSAPLSLMDDYANTIHAGPLVNDTNGGGNTTSDGDVLLQGTVLEVLLDATGDNTLDILVNITGGALQFDNPDPDVGVFAANGRGILRIAGVTMPSNWSGNFSLNGATVDFLGIPEPGTLALGLLAMAFACAARRPQRNSN